MQVRDALEQGRPGSIAAPCAARTPACPLLRKARDWCHMELPWQRPTAVAALERRAQIGQEPLKASYLLLRNVAAQSREGQRLIGGLMTDRQGVQRRYVCAADGVTTLRGKTGRLPAPVATPPRGAWLGSPLPGGVIMERERRG